MWVDRAGNLYDGDRVAGDRAATTEEIAAWQAARAAAAVPRRVTNFQGRTVLRLHDLFDAVQGAISAIEDPLQKAIAQDAFDRGGFELDSELLNQVLSQMGHDAAFRDALFVEAAAISI